MSQNREEALLAWALEKPPEKREAFLEGACFGDPDLRRRIESRLSAAKSLPLAEIAEAAEKRITFVLTSASSAISARDY